MAGSLTNYAEQQVLYWLTGKQVTTKGTTSGSGNVTTVGEIYAKLFTALPTGDASANTTTTSTANNGTVDGGIPAFQLNRLNNADQYNWTLTGESEGQTLATYTTDISFTRSTGSADTDLVGVGLFDAADNCIAYTNFSANKRIAANETLVISGGTLKISLT